jgi:poly(hydroxyalkanoate) granule-associated protein
MPKKSDPPSSSAMDARTPQNSAQQIWLAGLGAFAKAQQQGGKVFDALVQDGLAMQRKTQEAARSQMTEASEKLGALAGGLGARAGQPWDRLEGIFEERVARALQRLNMASRAEVEELQARVAALEAGLRKALVAKTSAPRQKTMAQERPGAATAATRRGKARD